MKTIAASLLIAAAAFGANAYADPVNNEIGAPVLGLAQSAQVSRAQIAQELQAAPASVADSSNEIGSPAFGLARNNSQVSRAQVEQELTHTPRTVGLNSVYFGA
jgi:hypothetical protein